MAIPKIQRRNQFRTITVSAFPIPGVLPSEVLTPLLPEIDDVQGDACRPATSWRSAASTRSRVKGFGELASSWPCSVALIYLALVIQFDNAIKPLHRLRRHPLRHGRGARGPRRAWASRSASWPSSGVASLVGVIVSHVIVLFDFIEEAHHEGVPLREALLDAGIVRLRPVHDHRRRDRARARARSPCTAGRCGSRSATRRSAG